MTGVVEVAAMAGLVSAAMGKGHLDREKQRKEDAVGNELYKRFFNGDLFECSPDRRTDICDSLPAEVHPRAAKAVAIIERYQKARKNWILGMLETSTERVGDARTHILEEMKQWLATVTENSLTVKDIQTRLDYCRQIVLRPSIFKPEASSKSQRSFLQTVGEVCLVLEELLRNASANDRGDSGPLRRCLDIGRDLVDAMTPVLVFSVLSEPAAPKSAIDEVPQNVVLTEMLEAVGNTSSSSAVRGSTKTSSGIANVVTMSTDVGQLLRALYRGKHFAEVGASDQELIGELARPSGTLISGTSPNEAPLPAELFDAVAEEILARWSISFPEQSDSGLRGFFCGQDHASTRSSYVAVCRHLDRVAFFLSMMRRYIHISSIAGDMAAARLGGSLAHLLQELDTALADLRMARMDLMRAAKQQLRALAADPTGGGKITRQQMANDRRWMQSLRHVQETSLDALQRSLAREIVAARTAVALGRGAELQASAKRGLQDISTIFASADFQARCKAKDELRKALPTLTGGVAGGEPLCVDNGSSGNS